MKDVVSCPTLMTSLSCYRCQGVTRWASLPYSCYFMADNRQNQFSFGHILGASLLEPSPPGSALLCCSIEVHSLLSRMLPLVRGRDISPALMTPGPTLPLVQVVRGEKGGGYLFLIHATTLDISFMARPPMLISSGLVHLQLLQCEGPALSNTAGGCG